jgi:hypothetical protein
MDWANAATEQVAPIAKHATLRKIDRRNLFRFIAQSPAVIGFADSADRHPTPNFIESG